jgi:hypothetical protein
MNNISIEQKARQTKRISFNHEENMFLVQLLVRFKFIDNENEKWKTISLIFNSAFFKTQRTTKIIRNHYNNALNPDLKRDKFTEKENEKFLVLFDIHEKQIRKIANLMKRTESSVQNHFNRISDDKTKQTKDLIEKEGFLLHSDFSNQNFFLFEKDNIKSNSIN